MIEVVIALAILGFGVLAAAAAQLGSMRMGQDSRLRTEAYYLAAQQVETFRSMTDIQLDAEIAAGNTDPDNPLDPDPNDAIPRSFTRTWTITKGVPETGMYTIEVNVTWTDGIGVVRTATIENYKTST